MNCKVGQFVKVKDINTPILIRNVFQDDKGTVINYVPEYRHNGMGPNNKNIKLADVEFVVKWVKDEQYQY